MKRESGAWEYNGATLSLGNINTGTWSPSWVLDARLTTLFFKKNIVLPHPKK
jgi:hypothetical protein